jgi:predicted metal-binding protein
MEEQRKKIQGFEKAFVFSTKQDLESPFDFDGMFFKALVAHQHLTSEMYQRFSPAHPVYGAGSCCLCKECARPEPCRFPEKRVSSLEAAGIDVTALSRTTGIGYNNGDFTVTYFSIILFDEP